MKKIAWVFLALGLIILFSNCSKDDKAKASDPLGRYHKLYNKMWYNTDNQSRGDHYFTPIDSNSGTFTVDHPFMPDYTGIYNWYPTGDSMHVVINDVDFSFHFKEIQDHFMSYAPSNELENVYTFQDTKP